MAIQIDGAGTITGVNATGISAQPVFPGQVLQVVSNQKTSASSTTSTSYVDVSGASISITPIQASSDILLIFSFGNDTAMSSGVLSFGRYRIVDASNTPIPTAGENLIGHEINTLFSGVQYSFNRSTMIAKVSPGTTSPVTYKLQFRVSVATTNATVYQGSFIAMEIAG